MNMLSNSDPKHNICAYTYNQTSGRGQIGRKWYSGSDKNISCSYRYQCLKVEAKDQFYINMAFALTILSFIQTFVEENVTIKWPNDIYVGDNKIAGILIQNSLKANLISSTILGVGINVNQVEFPVEIPNPTSLYLEGQKEYNLLELQLLLSDILEEKMQLVQQSPELIKDAYQSHLYRINEKHQFNIEDTLKEGIILGVSETGKLQLEIDGLLKEYNFRELQFVIKQ